MSNAFPKRGLTLLLMRAVVASYRFAGSTASAQAACSYPEAQQVFAPWNDKGWYQLAPEGSLSAGGNATSPPVCVDPTIPDFRFMMRNVSDKSTYLVDNLYVNPFARQ